jgi:hypothetical protein
MVVFHGIIENSICEGRAKWWVVDTPKPQQQLTTLKKEDTGNPKKTPTISHDQQETKFSLKPQRNNKLKCKTACRSRLPILCL